jgi:hypothetical protein
MSLDGDGVTLTHRGSRRKAARTDEADIGTGVPVDL